jgi:uncharacterized protein
MKANLLAPFLAFFALVTFFQSAAQQSEADRKLLTDIRAKAEMGDAQAQLALGSAYYTGNAVTKDLVEAVKLHRKAAEQGVPVAQFLLALYYANGDGVKKNPAEAVKWLRKAAEQNYAAAQFNLGLCYARGDVVKKNVTEAVKWYRKAADQDFAEAERELGRYYLEGRGVAKDFTEGITWIRKAAEQGDALAQNNLGLCYFAGQGVTKEYIEAYKWLSLAAAQDNEEAQNTKKTLWMVEQRMSREQVAQAQALAREFKPRKPTGTGVSSSREGIVDSRPAGSGSGFFVTKDGFLITNEHVVRNAGQIRLVTGKGVISARTLKVDSANDLALLKADGKLADVKPPQGVVLEEFEALPIAPSRTVRMGSTVATVGFPNIGLQGFAPKLAKGEIAALTGAQDDPRYFQISVPIQPGNSGGALVDERGNVVGIVSAKLNVAAAVAASGALPENVNYAVKSSFLLSFLESVPEVAAKVKEPNTKDRKFEDVVKSAEQAAVLVLVY